jgi:DNA replication licensing factor MCM6
VNFLWHCVAGTGLSGMKQRDLIKWYVELQNEKNKYRSTEDAAQEVSEIKAIIEVYTYLFLHP